MFKSLTKNFSSLFSRNKLSNWNSWNILGGQIHSKRNVTPKGSLAYPVVYACVNLISSDLATMPFGVYEEKVNGSQKAFKHDQYYLLKKRPHKFYSTVQYRKALVANYLLWGNGYAKIHRNKSSRPIAYEIIKPNQIEPLINNGELFYKNYQTGEVIHYMDMIHIADLSFDGLRGFSKISIASESIDLGKSSIEFSNDFLDNGAHLSGYIKLDSKLSAKGQKSLKKSFLGAYQGRSNTGGLGVLEQGAEYKPFEYSMPLSDAQLLESRKFQVEEIARIFNVPPHKIGHLEKSSFNNIEQQNIEYVQNTLSPISVLIEMEHDCKIFREREQNTHFTKIELKGLLRGDVKTRTEYYKAMVDRGVLSPNEIRQKEDMPTYEGGDMKILPLNFVSVENFDNPEFRKGNIKKEE